MRAAKLARIAVLAALGIFAADEVSAQSFQTTLEELRIDLKLAPEQGPAWDAFAEKIQAFKSDLARQRSRRAGSTEKRDALQQLDRMVDAERNRLTAMEEIAVAANALYDVLTPEQKTVADRRLANIVVPDARSSQ